MRRGRFAVGFQNLGVKRFAALAGGSSSVHSAFDPIFGGPCRSFHFDDKHVSWYFSQWPEGFPEFTVHDLRVCSPST